MKDLDVCFVLPPRPWLVSPHAQAPQGVLYLAAVCEQAGMSVAIRNLAGSSPAFFSAFTGIPPANAYGLSGTYLDIDQINDLAKELRRWFPDARILAGGPLSLSADEISDSVDTIVHGEAENVIVDLLRGPCSSRVVVAEAPDPLDAVLPPARHLWAGPFGGNVFIGGHNYFGGGSTTIVSSRGCLHRCAFCASQSLASRKVRRRSPSSVVEEMERCVVDYGVRQFRFTDEHITASPAALEGLCDAISDSSLLRGAEGCAWRASIAAKPASREMFESMKRAGCREVSIGIESADPAVLAMIHKPATPYDGRNCLSLAGSVGLGVRALMMIGLPGTTAETLRHDIDFLAEDMYDALALTVFTPIPGSAIAQTPEAYHCRILDTKPMSLCLYGPQGMREIAPTIDIDGMSLDDHTRQIRDFVRAAEGTGKLGRG